MTLQLRCYSHCKHPKPTHPCAQFRTDAHKQPTYSYTQNMAFPHLSPWLSHHPYPTGILGGAAGQADGAVDRGKLFPKTFHLPLGSLSSLRRRMGQVWLRSEWGYNGCHPGPSPSPSTLLGMGWAGRVEGWGSYILGLEPLTWLLVPPGFLRFREEPEHSQSTRAGGKCCLDGVGNFLHTSGHSVSQVNFRPVWSEGMFVLSSQPPGVESWMGHLLRWLPSPQAIEGPWARHFLSPGLSFPFVKWGKWNTSTAETYWNTSKSERGGLLHWVFKHFWEEKPGRKHLNVNIALWLWREICTLSLPGCAWPWVRDFISPASVSLSTKWGL